MEPPGYNNTEFDKLKYENFDRNGEIPNLQSHKKQSCASTDRPNVHRDNNPRDTTTAPTVPPNKSNSTTTITHKTESCVSTDLPNIHRDNNSRDTTTESNYTTTTTITMVQNFKSPIIKIAPTDPITITTTTPNERVVLM